MPDLFVFYELLLNCKPIIERSSTVRVISKSRLVQFWETLGRDDSEGPLQAWYPHVSSRSVDWHSWADIKVEFATATGRRKQRRFSDRVRPMGTRLCVRKFAFGLVHELEYVDIDTFLATF